MTDSALRSIIIVGGGTAGWISAAILARFVDPARTRITLVESEDISIVGVGEATVPILRNLNGLIGIDENAFVAATNGSFKLGIEFRDWGQTGRVHFHGFGDYGDAIEGVSPHHHWLRLRAAGDETPIEDYSFPYAVARRGRFQPNDPDPAKPASFYRYAFHFDAALYARFLRAHCEARGVVRQEGRVVDVALNGENGNIASITLASGQALEADFFIDCSGFQGLLIEQALNTGYISWKHWLPCDSAVVVPTASAGPPAPYTVSTALPAGWQWRIPLQHREGNGHVYASDFISDDAACATLLATVKGAPLADPRILRFTAGHRRKYWNRNCVAVGLAAGFMEPLESTSIQLIQTAMARLIELFPDRNGDPAIADEYNRLTLNEYERIRDFLILHYAPSKRPEPLWEHCRTMPIPDTLAHKIDVWMASGTVPMLTEESYQLPSWAAIFLGNDMIPRRHDPIADRMDIDRLRRGMAARRRAIAEYAERLPSHEAFIRRHCAMADAA